MGFDRIKWIKNNEKTFDDLFRYKRIELEKFEVQNILKKGSPKEKDQIRRRLKKLSERSEINKRRNFKMRR